MSKEKYPTKEDIYTLYDFYRQYKTYYEFYWVNKQYNNITQEDINERIREIYQKKRMGGVIDALCFFANIPKEELFNSDGTEKNFSELEVLQKIDEVNYGETND
jgi:hypothetical protein